jgi:hypothetical protein
MRKARWWIPTSIYLAPSTLNIDAGRREAVKAFYHPCSCEDPGAMEYSRGRGIADKNIFDALKLG